MLIGVALIRAGGDRPEVLRDEIDMPVLEVDRGRLDDVPGLEDVKAQTVAHDNPIAVEVRMGLAGG
jgi:hypothetical protein